MPLHPTLSHTLTPSTTLLPPSNPSLFLPQLTNQFAWAVPNARALAIIAHFAPIVEVGSGTGYWAGELKARGVDINAYDIDVSEPDTLWDKVYI